MEDNEKKITPKDLRAQSEELIRQGKMPQLEDLLKAVSETRKKYHPLLKS